MLAAAPAPAQAPAPVRLADIGRCGTCHPRERVDYETSRHATEGVRCVDCHGGNDRTLTPAEAHRGNFIGRPSKAASVRLCAGCHSDVERMRPYNLPVDQHALYLTSQHGQLLARGNNRVAACADCHGAHDIRPPSDPASRVHPLNIPRTCGACHGDTSGGAADGSGKNAFTDYAASVHGRELLDRSNPRAPTCVSCHGVHGAAPPNFGDVNKVCGRCHTVERRYFVAGAHRPRAGAATPECTTCHGHHTVAETRPERLAGLCASCHGEGSTQAATGQRLWTEYQGAAAGLGSAAAVVAEAEAVPINTDDYRARLEEGHTYLLEALIAAHAVDDETVASFTGRARAIAAEVESEARHKIDHAKERYLFLVVFWFYLLLTLLVLRGFRGRRAPEP